MGVTAEYRDRTFIKILKERGRERERERERERGTRIQKKGLSDVTRFD